MFLSSSFASSTVLSPGRLKATEIYFPINNTGKKISLMQLSTINMNELQTLTGRKMNFAERIAFKTTQRKLKRNINADGTIEKRKLERFFVKRGGEYGFHFGGFALGFFLGIIGVFIAYLIHDDYRQNRLKWAWIGFGIIFVINLIALVAAMSSGAY